LENLGVYGRTALNGTLKKRMGEREPVAGFYEHGNEPSGSIKYGEFLD
jgi:hypothetical protein